MGNNIENTVGLQHCYWKTNGKPTAPQKGKTYYLYEKDKNEFYVDEDCVGGKTTNPQHTIANARWAFIYEFFFNRLEKAKEEDIKENLWGPLSGGTENVSKYALGTNYKVGKNIVFKPSGYSYYYGFKQRIELFSNSPGSGFYFNIIPVTTSQISYAYFNKSEDVKHYGDSINLEIMMHGYNLDEKNKYKGKLYLLEEEKAKLLTQTEDFEDENLWEEPKIFTISQSTSDSSNYNSYYKTSFPIELEWKKDQTTKKNFTIVLEIYRVWEEKGIVYGTNAKEERVNFRNFADDPTTDLVEYDAELLGLKDLDNKASISSRFIVSEELMDHYLTRIEQEKNNMIQYIGDIKYTKREFDPCGYSKITIQDKGDKERGPLVIFDETRPVNQIDSTHNVFAIIAGDERKDIAITLDGLQTKNQFCQGLLLDDGQKHSEHKNVFQVDKVYSAYNNGKAYLTYDDTTHQEQQRNAGIVITEENKTDTDVVKADKSASNPSAAQQWIDGRDYKIGSDKEITLKLRYLYNKTAFEGKIENNYTAEVVNNLWLFNYFILNEEKAQIYFLPISTCRYPNQIAKIKVYPNVSWTFHFNYGMKNPLYYRDTWVEMRPHRVENAVLRAQASDIDGYDGSVSTEFTLSIEAKWNETESAKLDQKISEKVKLLIGSFIKVKQFVDKVTGKDRGTSTEGLTGDILARIQRTPLSIEVLSPQISVGAGWEYKNGRKEQNLNNEVAFSLGIVAKADPAIGAEAVIDLIAWGKKIHPAANAVITSLDLLTYAANAEVRFDLKFYGKLLIDGNIELSRLKKDGNIKAEGQFGFELYLQAKATAKFDAFFTEVDLDFEAKAQAEGYFSLGLLFGLDDFKGLYAQPIIRHSGIKIILSVYVKVNGFNRTKKQEIIVIKEGQASIDEKYYIN